MGLRVTRKSLLGCKCDPHLKWDHAIFILYSAPPTKRFLILPFLPPFDDCSSRSCLQLEKVTNSFMVLVDSICNLLHKPPGVCFQIKWPQHVVLVSLSLSPSNHCGDMSKCITSTSAWNVRLVFISNCCASLFLLGGNFQLL